MNIRKRVAACRLKKKNKNWKYFGNHKWSRGEMGEKFLHFWQRRGCWWPATLVLITAVGDKRSLQSLTSGQRGAGGAGGLLSPVRKTIGLSHFYQAIFPRLLRVGARITFLPMGSDLFTKWVGLGQSKHGKPIVLGVLMAAYHSYSADRMDRLWLVSSSSNQLSGPPQHTLGCPLLVGVVGSGYANKFDHQSN